MEFCVTMLTLGSLETIYKELGDSERVVACFANLIHDIPTVEVLGLCTDVPKFLSSPILDLAYNIIEKGGYTIFNSGNIMYLIAISKSYEIFYDSHGDIEKINKHIGCITLEYRQDY